MLELKLSWAAQCPARCTSALLSLNLNLHDPSLFLPLSQSLSLTFDVAVDDPELLVQVVQSFKQLEGVVESGVRRKRTVLKHILL